MSYFVSRREKDYLLSEIKGKAIGRRHPNEKTSDKEFATSSGWGGAEICSASGSNKPFDIGLFCTGVIHSEGLGGIVYYLGREGECRYGEQGSAGTGQGSGKLSPNAAD